MSTLLRVLLVEDSENDAVLILREIQKAGYAIESRRVENADQMQAALDEHGWDIITADYSLPQFDAPSALAVLQKKRLDIPFIVISGHISDDEAVALMKAGAQDYLRKDSLARLTEVLERELVQAQKRRDKLEAEAALRLSEGRYRTLVEQASDGIFIADADGNYLDINPSGCAQLGYTYAEMLKLNLSDLLTREDLAREPVYMAEMLSGRTVISQHRMRRKDGSTFYAEISAKILPDGRLQGIMRDVTERKLAEDELRHLNRVYALTSQVNEMVVRTRDPQEIFANVCRIAVEDGKFRMAWIGLVDEDTQTVKPVSWAGEERGYLATIKAISVGDNLQGRGPTGTAIRMGQLFFCNDIANDSMMLPWREEALSRGYRASIALPVIVHGKVTGAFNLYAGEAFFFNPNEIRLLQDVTGDFAYALEMVENEKRRMAAEQQLRESEMKFRLLVDQSPSGIMMLSPEGVIIGWNHAQEDIYGFKKEEVLGRPAWEVQVEFQPEAERTPENMAAVKQRILQILNTGQSPFLNRTIERLITRADGTHRWVDRNIFTVNSTEGFISVTVTNDITERKQAEQTLHLQSAALENAANAITITDVEGIIQWTNPAWTDLTGYSAEEALGKNPRILNSGMQDQSYYRNLWETITRGDVWHGELINKRKDGTLYAEEEIITPVHSESGNITHFVAIKQDITERKRAEAALRQAHAELEQRVQERTADLQVANLALEKAARLKDDFLASMSHELRTPLTGILGLAEALQMVTYGDLNDKQRSALKNIETSGRHLLALINDILDLSKIEAGRFDLQLEACSLGDICKSSLQLTRGMANQKRQLVSFHMDPPAIILKADARRLKQMLVNLLGNAIKFTPEGGKLGIEVRGDEKQQKLYITVWDDGIGIREEDLPRLFQPFVQLDSSLSRQYAGTGLGLSLVQRLAELHEGEVKVTSSPGNGSRFTIILPWPTEAARSALQDRKTTPVTAALRARKDALPGQPLVLMADDNETALNLVGDYLAAQNYRVVSTRSGPEFLEKLGLVRADVVLMDIQMPGMDGIEVIRRVRAHPDARTAKLPVIAVTALAMPGDRERCLAAGATAYMSKPVRLKELGNIIADLVGRTK